MVFPARRIVRPCHPIQNDDRLASVDPALQALAALQSVQKACPLYAIAVGLFETILVLLLVTILLLQVSRRLGTPYPSLLALAGVAVGVLPGAPRLEIEPHLALALFVAPVLLDAAFDTDPR